MFIEQFLQQQSMYDYYRTKVSDHLLINKLPNDHLLDNYLKNNQKQVKQNMTTQVKKSVPRICSEDRYHVGLQNELIQ
ncbi:hypothetical protein C1645_753578 [Glomus cerebriforme]|uniref:Uncharacterized protein n=1 Tax=Glomus cerebriforme TaxID=658196 RepID=A0A397TFI0_9GLOM|nr:hypothetical protein C1645_753578 [Glomus cerebriforme]